MGALLEDIFNRANRRNTRFLEQLASDGLISPVVEPAVLSEAITGVAARFAEQAVLTLNGSPSWRRACWRSTSAWRASATTSS
jgi:hypothetical protein